MAERFVERDRPRVKEHFMLREPQGIAQRLRGEGRICSSVREENLHGLSV